jgi:DNA invertase Pin-like site-specific DNA recombinase
MSVPADEVAAHGGVREGLSTAGQDGQLQRDALEKAACERIFEDVASGAKADRPGLSQALAYVREGDERMVWKNSTD